MTADELAPRLLTWARSHYGGGVHVDHVRSLGGHSGVTIGFDVLEAGQPIDRLVLKMPPAGVSRKGSYDVLRQVPLLRVLEEHGVPAPAVRWSSDDESLLGGPYLMMSRLSGASPPDLFRPEEAGRGVDQPEQLFREAIEALVKIHAIDALGELGDWSAPRLPPAEIEYWVAVLHKSSNAAWIAQGMALRELLHRAAPEACSIGLVHGDFYSNNWLFDSGHLAGIVDWEGTSVGPVLLDLGWVCMMYDPHGWGPVRRASMHWQPGPEQFIEVYAGLSSANLGDLPFYRALAAYRLACLTAYYVELHRSGKRPNPAWDVFADSFPFMVARASALLMDRIGRVGAGRTAVPVR
ncbi:phosphotransferase family protein [Chelatococcus reniformis]|uniref:Aminoglycoside phosphotransferase n=1 Tax=Chelatococcus reniformis TaxID=1494448 RepID=A0A916UMF4_9HYPH|nr:phosphotransferase family protein [Chelatococcus reniformis]GGC77235.1 putative aminoglycoside phosphotransferase [Chelatococcus reniformis]